MFDYFYLIVSDSELGWFIFLYIYNQKNEIRTGSGLDLFIIFICLNTQYPEITQRPDNTTHQQNPTPERLYSVSSVAFH